MKWISVKEELPKLNQIVLLKGIFWFTERVMINHNQTKWFYPSDRFYREVNNEDWWKPLK